MLVNCGPIKTMHYENRFALFAEPALVQGQWIVYAQWQSNTWTITANKKINFSF